MPKRDPTKYLFFKLFVSKSWRQQKFWTLFESLCPFSTSKSQSDGCVSINLKVALKIGLFFVFSVFLFIRYNNFETNFLRRGSTPLKAPMKSTIVSQGTFRKVSHLSISLVIIMTLVSLTSCDVMELSKFWCHVWSALWLSPTMAPPPYFVYICTTLSILWIIRDSQKWKTVKFDLKTIFCLRQRNLIWNNWRTQNAIFFIFFLCRNSGLKSLLKFIPLGSVWPDSI